VRVQNSFSQINILILVFSDILEIVLNATGEASNHWQLINVPSHVLADYGVISKSQQKEPRFKRKIRTEQDNLGATVSEEPLLVAFG
jgi:hypothetical protein